MPTSEQPSSPLLRALGRAADLGRADGRLAVGIEPVGEPVPMGSWCHGLAPDELADLVWDAAAGPAPAGVVLNAPLWYAQGFREALAGARDQLAGVPRPREGVGTGTDEPGRAGPPRPCGDRPRPGDRPTVEGEAGQDRRDRIPAPRQP
ncbi:hypothetical protein [Geodermatophilus sp. SYSU D01176]